MYTTDFVTCMNCLCRGCPTHEMGNEAEGGFVFSTSLGILQ